MSGTLPSIPKRLSDGKTTQSNLRLIREALLRPVMLGILETSLMRKLFVISTYATSKQ